MNNIFKFKNPELLLIAFLSFLFYYNFLSSLQIPIQAYVIQYYLYDYSLGFVKRGLVGQFLSFFSDHYKFADLYKICLFLFLFFIFLLVKIIDSIHLKFKLYNYILLTFIFLHPALLKNIWYDFGRLDIFSLIYCTFLIFSYTYKKYTLSNSLLFLSPILLFIHEGNLILWLPTLYCSWLIFSLNKYNKKTIIFYSLIFLFITSISFIFNLLYGNLNIDFYSFTHYLQSKTDVKIDLFEDTVVNGNISLFDAFYASFKENISAQKITYIYGSFFVIFIFYFMKLILMLNNINYKRYIYYIVFPILVTSTMFILGIDKQRWFSNMCFSILFISLTILLTNQDIIKKEEKETVDISKVVLLIILLIIQFPFYYLGVVD